MLEVKFLGQFNVQFDGWPVEIPSRASQSLLAYLILNAGTTHRREKLAGLLWPEVGEAISRTNLRRALWSLRKAIELPQTDGRNFLLVDGITVAFDAASDYWLDAGVLDRKLAAEAPAEELIELVSLYRGELLPGFYDDWVVLERERLQAGFEHKMALLLERLAAEQRWSLVLEWAERWIALGQVPEPAYRALMYAEAGLGDLSSMAAVYRRCVEALSRDLGVEPSDQTRELYTRLSKGERLPGVPLAPVLPARPISLEETQAIGEPPFKGLQYFDEADADLFFGRERLVAKIVARLTPQPPLLASAPAPGEARGGVRFLAVVGASGSGKSSLVRAGLIPALKRGERLDDGSLPPSGSSHWPVHLLTPTAHPLEALAASLTRDSESVTATTTLINDLASDPRSLHLAVRQALGRTPADRLLLVVDQFEEFFTHCRSEAERQAFIDNLLTATGAPHPALPRIAGEDWSGDSGPTIVVITLRADFYAHCARYPELREALARDQEYIGPMSAEELRRAIEEPARLGGWEFEPGLVDLLLREVGGEPGSLPLLSHALLETWRHRQGRALTLKGYAASGGVRGAIARTAETVFNHQLTPGQQTIARGIFLRLTELGEGTQDTRRRAALSELVPRPQEAEAVGAVLQTLADARLITTAEGTAEVAHEALIREWPALRQWLTEDREGLRLHRHLTAAAQTWETLGRDAGELYRGARLAQALEWARAHAAHLNVLEWAFLDASSELAERRVQEREAQRQRELETAQRLAEAERKRAEEQTRAAQAAQMQAAAETGRAEDNARAAQRLRRRAVYLTLALVVALFLAIAAILLSQSERREARLAFTRELAAAAIGNLDVDPERSILLALQAVSQTYSVDQTGLPEAENALHRAIQASRVIRTLTGHAGPVLAIAFSPDGTRLATASQDHTARVWDAASGQQLLSHAHTGTVEDLAFSPDGMSLATASNDGTARVWDIVSNREFLTLADHDSAVFSIAFSPDGSRIATGDENGNLKLWDAATGQELFSIPAHTGAINDLAFSPDGAGLASASRDTTAKIWDAATGQQQVVLSGHRSIVEAVAFSPDGTRVITSSWDVTAIIWDAASGQVLLTLPGHTGAIFGTTWSADGTRVATSSLDGRTEVWDARSGQELFSLAGHSGGVTAAAFSPDGLRLATSSLDNTAKVWDISPQAGRELLLLSGHTGPVNRIVFSPDGTRLGSAGWDGTAKIWDANSGVELQSYTGHEDKVLGIAFSLDGDQVATVSQDGTMDVWEAATGRELFSVPVSSSALTGQGIFGGVLSVAFSRDGARLATGSADGSVKIWNAALDAPVGENRELLRLPGHTDYVETVLFNLDGTRLATASWDRTAKVWDASPGTLEPANREIYTLGGHTTLVLGVALSPDETLLATASSDGTVKIWEASSGQLLRTLSGHAGGVSAVAFSPDGERLATAGTDATAKIWNAVTGQELVTLTGHTRTVFDLAYSPDGSRLATASFDGTVRVYLLPIEDLVALANSRVTRSLTLEECRKFLHLEQCPSAR